MSDWQPARGRGKGGRAGAKRTDASPAAPSTAPKGSPVTNKLLTQSANQPPQESPSKALIKVFPPTCTSKSQHVVRAHVKDPRNELSKPTCQQPPAPVGSISKHINTTERPKKGPSRASLSANNLLISITPYNYRPSTFKTRFLPSTCNPPVNRERHRQLVFVLLLPNTKASHFSDNIQQSLQNQRGINPSIAITYPTLPAPHIQEAGRCLGMEDPSCLTNTTYSGMVKLSHETEVRAIHLNGMAPYSSSPYVHVMMCNPIDHVTDIKHIIKDILAQPASFLEVRRHQHHTCLTTYSIASIWGPLLLIIYLLQYYYTNTEGSPSVPYRRTAHNNPTPPPNQWI